MKYSKKKNINPQKQYKRNSLNSDGSLKHFNHTWFKTTQPIPRGPGRNASELHISCKAHIVFFFSFSRKRWERSYFRSKLTRIKIEQPNLFSGLYWLKGQNTYLTGQEWELAMCTAEVAGGVKRLKDEAHLKRAVWRLKRKVWQRWYRDWDLDSCNTYCVIPSLWQLRENNTFKKRRRRKKNPPQYDGD